MVEGELLNSILAAVTEAHPGNDRHQQTITLIFWKHVADKLSGQKVKGITKSIHLKMLAKKC